MAKKTDEPTVADAYLTIKWELTWNGDRYLPKVISALPYPPTSVDSSQTVVKVQIKFPAGYYENRFPTIEVEAPMRDRQIGGQGTVPDDVHVTFPE